MLKAASSQQKAFTLLELIVVIVILAILAALAIPTFARVIGKSKDETAAASLSSIARNTQAINAFMPTSPMSPNAADEAVKETKGKGATSETFTLADGSLGVTPGATGTSSSEYGEVGLALSQNSEAFALSMVSTSGNCVWVKASSGAAITWKVSENPVDNCDSTFGLTITGPGGEVIDPGEVTPPITIDPEDPNSPIITGEYCVDNACATPELLNASALEINFLGTDAAFKGAVIDTDNNRMIATRFDGIYFVNLETGESKKVYDGTWLSDPIYLPGGTLIVNDSYLFKKFSVTPGGVTLLDDNLIEHTQTIEGTSEIKDVAAWSATSAVLDVTKSGASVYFSGANASVGPTSPSKYYNAMSFVAKSSVNGDLSSEPLAYSKQGDGTALKICAVSVDENYMYIQATSTFANKATAPGETNGIWRVSKDATNVNIGKEPAWHSMPAGCFYHQPQARFIASGSKLFISDGENGIMSIDTTTHEETFLAGEGTWGDSAPRNAGIGRAGTFAYDTTQVPGMLTHGGKIYMLSSSMGNPGLAVLAPATPLENNIENRQLSVSGQPSLLATTPGAYSSFAVDPITSDIYVSEASGGFKITPEGQVSAAPAMSTPLRSSMILGNKIFSGQWTSLTDAAGSYPWMHRLNGVSYCMDSSKAPTAITTRTSDGVLWCLDTEGLSSYENVRRPQMHLISNIESVFEDGFEVVRVSVSGEQAFVVTSKPDMSLNQSHVKVFSLNLSQENPSFALITNLEGYAGILDSWSGVAVSATDLYLPSSEGIVKVSKNGESSLAVIHPESSPDNPIMKVIHDGTTLSYVTMLGEIYQVK